MKVLRSEEYEVSKEEVLQLPGHNLVTSHKMGA
jgi:hypothetical protein